MSSVEEKAPKKLSVKAQIEQVKLKHDDLSKRSADLKIARDLLPEVWDFIDQLRKMGRDVPPGANRDLLISLASFWATYYFQHSEENTYPPTTLEPYLGKGEGSGSITGVFQQMLTKEQVPSSWGSGSAQEQTPPQAAASWFLNLTLFGRILVIAAPLVLIGIVAMLALNAANGIGTEATPPMTSTQRSELPPTWTPEPTQLTYPFVYTVQEGDTLADLSSQFEIDPATILAFNPQLQESGVLQPGEAIVIPAPGTQLPTETGEQIQTPVSGETVVPQDTPLPTTPAVGSGIENQGVTVLINNLNDLQEVLPQTELNVSFANFSPGWSMHLLLQPLSKGLTYYPVPDYFLVEKGYGSGDWNVTVSFGLGADLDNREQYAITPVMATSDAAREALAAAAQTGLEQLPEGVFTSPQLITRIYTVVRRAYTVINEVRVIYTAKDEKATNMDLWAMRLDGSDPLQLTDTPEISELHPSLSPDGTRIAFVGRNYAEKGSTQWVYTLWLMNSDGSNRVTIAQDPTLIYDRPLWSPDGKTLVYNTSPADASVKGVLASWAIYLYDLAADRTNRLDTGLAYVRHPAWAADGRTLYFSAINPESGTLGIYQVSLDSLEVTRVYDDKENEIQPVVSPMKQAAFPGLDARDLYVLDLNTGRWSWSIRRTCWLGYAVWSPDGESIYFEANINSAYALWMVKVGG
jgi:LysM repeat protein